MTLAYHDLAAHPALIAAVRQQALTLLAIQEASPRISAVFATQQRWLMAHVALSQHFRSLGAGEGEGLRLTRFIETIAALKIASKNTADAFVKEMQKYGYIEKKPHSDKRTRRLAPSAHAIQTISAWLAAHLAALDALDKGGRHDAFLARPQFVAAIQPMIADGILASSAIREPAPTFSLFTWLNEGGVVMDWLIAGLADVPPGVQRIPSTVLSFDDLGERINLSRSHLMRKLRMAEAMGSLGWVGERGKSTMWVSAEFRAEYLAQQCAKLAIIDEAFHSAISAPSASFPQ